MRTGYHLACPKGFYTIPNKKGRNYETIPKYLDEQLSLRDKERFFDYICFKEYTTRSKPKSPGRLDIASVQNYRTVIHK